MLPLGPGNPLAASLCEPRTSDRILVLTANLPRHGLERWSIIAHGYLVPFQTVAHEQQRPWTIARSEMSRLATISVAGLPRRSRPA